MRSYAGTGPYHFSSVADERERVLFCCNDDRASGIWTEGVARFGISGLFRLSLALCMLQPMFQMLPSCIYKYGGFLNQPGI